MKTFEEARLELKKLVVFEAVWSDGVWREAASNLLESLAVEVDRLTRERDEAKASAERWEFRAVDWMTRCEDSQGELDALRAMLPDGLDMYWSKHDEAPVITARGEADREAFEAVDDVIRALILRGGLPSMIPASHAEKVLVAVAKEAAKVGAEDALGRVLELVGKEEEVAKKKRQGAPSHDSWTHWDGRREQAEVIGKRVAALKESP